MMNADAKITWFFLIGHLKLHVQSLQPIRKEQNYSTLS